MSFACPHYRAEDDFCTRLKVDCVPGRRGCVLEENTVFAVPAEVRVREREEEKRRGAMQRIIRGSGGSPGSESKP